MATAFDLVVIGSGPGGYVAAIRAAQLGLSVACVEREKALGGTCLRVGCIPSKALLESSERYWETQKHLAEHGIEVESVSLNLEKMLKRKDKVVRALTGGVDTLFKKNKITRYQGSGRILDVGKVEVDGPDAATLEAKHILIATGSASATLPGIEMDGQNVVSSTEALAFPEVPERLVVIGAGYIGLEMGSVWQRLGSEVTVLEYCDRALPAMDAETAAAAQKQFQRQGLKFEFGTKVTAVRQTETARVVEREGAAPIEADKVLVAVGRVPHTSGLGLENVGIEVDGRGFIPVDEEFNTDVAGIYAIGDVVGGALLAHKAEEEGIACVERIATGYGHIDYNAIPAVVYTHPEVASVGQTEEELQQQEVAYNKGTFPYIANGRARGLGQTEGQVKVLADADSDRLLGVHIVGARAGDMIAEAATGMAFGASAEDVARATHAHPTLSEILKEAALSAEGRVIHI